MPNSRTITFAQAIHEATDQILGSDNDAFLIGEGVPDPKAIFGTTAGLQEKYGTDRVMDMPVSENGMTGVLIGAAVTGMKPILVHQRVDFSLYALDQVINNAAKWYSMYGGQSSCPLIIRMVIGKGWGQGNQHSQNLQSLYAHIPGLKVLVPSNAYQAKGMMISAFKDPNPVIFLEHRWLHNTTSHVPEEMFEVEIGKAHIAKEGNDITIATWSYMTLETLLACQFLERVGVKAEVLDLGSLTPLDDQSLKKSVQKTQKLLVVDASWRHGGFAGEVIARVAEDESIKMTHHPKRLTFPDYPSPSTPGLCQFYYPNVKDIVVSVLSILGREDENLLRDVNEYINGRIHDIPDKSFTGPF